MNILQSQHVCNQTWKTEGRGEQFVAKCDYYDLFLFFSPCSMIDELQVIPKQANKKTCKQSPSEHHSSRLTLLCQAHHKDNSRSPIKKQLKSNEGKLHNDSSIDWLFLMKLGIRLPLTEKSTDGRRPAVHFPNAADFPTVASKIVKI